MMRGHFLQIITPQQGKGDVHNPSPPRRDAYADTSKQSRRNETHPEISRNELEGAALHTPLPQLNHARQKSVTRVRSGASHPANPSGCLQVVKANDRHVAAGYQLTAYVRYSVPTGECRVGFSQVLALEGQTNSRRYAFDF